MSSVQGLCRLVPSIRQVSPGTTWQFTVVRSLRPPATVMLSCSTDTSATLQSLLRTAPRRVHAIACVGKLKRAAMWQTVGLKKRFHLFLVCDARQGHQRCVPRRNLSPESISQPRSQADPAQKPGLRQALPLASDMETAARRHTLDRLRQRLRSSRAREVAFRKTDVSHWRSFCLGSSDGLPGLPLWGNHGMTCTVAQREKTWLVSLSCRLSGFHRLRNLIPPRTRTA